MRTKALAVLLLLAAVVFSLVACETPPYGASGIQPDTNHESVKVSYADGIYRGFYNDGGIEQFRVEFALKGGEFTRVTLSEINYKDGDYLDENATRIQSQVASQYEEAANYLVGKSVGAKAELLDSTAVTTDRDAVTSATLRLGKLASAIGDGLTRGVFMPTDTTRLNLPKEAPDGKYRGFFYDSAKDTVAVSFKLLSNSLCDVAVTCEGDTAFASYCAECAKELEGKPLESLTLLYAPGALPHGATVTVEEAGMVRSAFMDAVKRGVFEKVETTVLTQLSGCKNGVYRGFYSEDGIEQVSVQFELVNDTFISLRYRALEYTDGNYMSERATDRQVDIYRQYLELADYLVGKDISKLHDLYEPAGIAHDTDAVSSATLSTGQLISAITDGLNRGVYRPGEID